MAKSSLPGKLLLVTLLAAGAWGGWYYWHQGGEKAPEVTTVAVTRGVLQQEVKATGALQPVTSVEISSQVSGLMKEVLVDFNDVVKKGQVLARIDEATYISKLRQAQAQLINTEANHALTKANTERTRSLYARQLVTDQELQQADAQLKQADAQLLIQRASVENAQIDLDRCTLLSPIDGVVIDRQTEVGKTVAASLNAPLLFLIVADLTKMQINAGVSEADIGSVTVGQDVIFLVDAFPGRPFRGTVSQIRNAPVTQSNVVTYGAIIAVDNSDLRLKPGMTANVSVITARRDNVLRLANAALRVRLPESLLPPQPSQPSATTGTGSGAAVASGQRGERGGRGEGGPRGSGERGGGGRGGRGGRGGGPGGAGSDDAPVVTTRTVFKWVGTVEKPQIEQVSVRFGITDGVNTEVLDGLTDGDLVVSGVAVSSGTGSASPAGAGGSPLQGRGGGGFGGGGGGGGGRGGGG